MDTKQNAIKIFTALMSDYNPEDAYGLALEYMAKFDKAYPETPLTQVPPLPWQSLADMVPKVGQGCYVTVWGFWSITRADWVGDPDGGDRFYWGAYRLFGDIFSSLEFADRVFWCGDEEFSSIDAAFDSLLPARTAFVSSNQ